MVRGLVEEEDVRLLEGELGEGQAALLPACAAAAGRDGGEWVNACVSGRARRGRRARVRLGVRRTREHPDGLQGEVPAEAEPPQVLPRLRRRRGESRISITSGVSAATRRERSKMKKEG